MTLRLTTVKQHESGHGDGLGQCRICSRDSVVGERDVDEN